MSDTKLDFTPEQLLFWLKGVFDAEANNRKINCALLRDAVNQSYSLNRSASKEPKIWHGTATGDIGLGGRGAYGGLVNLANTPTL